jgi:hypothetical protein
MRHTVYKLLWAWEYDKEEKWLNEMAAKGMALISVGLCKYIFEDSEPGEYTYKIELLDKMPSRSEAYIRFLEETGAEHVGSIFRWIYIRKKTSEGALDLYSDIESRIRYVRRLRIFFISLLFFELGIALMNFSIGAFSYKINKVNIFLGFLLLFIAWMCCLAAFRHTKKLRTLQRENQIRE